VSIDGAGKRASGPPATMRSYCMNTRFQTSSQPFHAWLGELLSGSALGTPSMQ